MKKVLKNRDTLPASGQPTGREPLSPAQGFLRKLLRSSLVLAEDWESLPAVAREEVLGCPRAGAVLTLLVGHGLLTAYQAARIRAGTTFGLVLGHYRVLDRLGAGGMAVVFKAEHILMRRQVALKVMPLSPHENPELLARFFTEIRTVARLEHPNIVAAIDAGKAMGADPDAPVLHYFVMEYVAGQDLEAYVGARGPLPPALACDLVDQVACALGEAHTHHLVHRDVKPTNVLVVQDRQAKLLDFGLARQFGNKSLTQPGAPLGTIDYMAPEQVRDPSQVDIRADIYGLGGTLFWCLIGRSPFDPQGSLTQKLMRRLTQEPPSVRSLRPDIPADLDEVVARMMAVSPKDRYQTPQEVMRALLPFQKLNAAPGPALGSGPPDSDRPAASAGNTPCHPQAQPILGVDGQPINRAICRHVVEQTGLAARESEMLHIRKALVLALARLVEQRHAGTGAHLLRLQRYARCLAERAAALAAFSGHIDPEFIRMLEDSVPLYDIGNVALPDYILLKPGKLDPDERMVMQSHTTVGADTLQAVAGRYGPALAFLQTAVEIARHHHERHDGTGYPDRLAGADIPLAARIVAVADVYDALRCRRACRPPLSHAAAMQVMTEESPGHFDPSLLEVFQGCATDFERAFRDLPDWMTA
ncbi:MAG TPA: HD domain-containing phosphohydrolase [Gemmataceae bacterium]|jgi:serine/threonine protein kinase|nr:HD domain-containing phosphohydrolase [Gemmataceae bacterium]